MRTVFLLCLMLMTSGCAVWTYFRQCDECALTSNSPFYSDDEWGILAVGLTVQTTTPSGHEGDDAEIKGSLGWFSRPPHHPNNDHPPERPPPERLPHDPAIPPPPSRHQSGAEMVELKFPEGLVPGERILVLWRVPAGRWALRHGRIGTGSNTRLSQIMPPWAKVTHVKPGRITYVGDVTVRTSEAATSVETSFDSSFAHQGLSAYPKIIADMDDMAMIEVHRERPRSH